MRFIKRFQRKIVLLWNKRFPKITVIVPFYNSAATMERCLQSVLSGTMIPMEIVCVSDGTTDDSLSLVRRYRERYPNIRLIDLRKNIGLFRARLAGIRAARGAYIGFLDSDDFVSAGYFDRLYAAASSVRADIAVGRIVNQTKDGVRYVQTRCETFPYTIGTPGNKTPEDLFWAQEGRCYHIHVVWNKLYRRQILKKNLSVFTRLRAHQVMMEDFIYSAVWFHSIRSYVTADGADYYYVENPASSIGDAAAVKIEKNLLDIQRAFSFVRQFLAERKIISEYGASLEAWKARYGRIWKKNILAADLSESERERCTNALHDVFGDEIGDYSAEDDYYYAEAKQIGE